MANFDDDCEICSTSQLEQVRAEGQGVLLTADE